MIRRIEGWLQRRADFPEEMLREQLAGGGPIAEFEKQLAAFLGALHCLAMNNATNGLMALAMALDLCGVEIIGPPQSWGGTYAPFEALGSTILRAAPDSHGNLCPCSVESLIGPKTRAVLAVDFNGHPHQMFALRRICDRYRLIYLADAAVAFGRTLRGRPASSLADAWVHSFGPGKPLDVGEGGAILTRDAALYEKLVALTQHPARFRREFSLTEANDYQPINCRIHPLAALMGTELLNSYFE